MPSFPPNARTLGLTPEVLENFGPNINEDEVCRVTVFVFASDHQTGQAFWEFRVLLRRMPLQLMTGIVQNVVQRQSAPASTWTAVITVEDNRVKATVTGGVGQTVDWLVTSDDILCMAGEFVG